MSNWYMRGLDDGLEDRKKLVLKSINERINFWKTEKDKIRKSKSKNFLTTKEGDIYACDVVIEELLKLKENIKNDPRN